MDHIRMKQAETLIKKAGSAPSRGEVLKDPREGTINVELFEKALKDFIEAEDFIYSSLPSHNLSSEEAQVFTRKLLDAREKIEGMLAEFGVMEKAKSEDEIAKISQEFLFITTKSNFKKLLIKMGVDAQQIIVAGVPLEAEDMKLMNPKIPDAALKSVNKKIQHVKNDISRKMEQLDLNNILVLAENDLSGELLGKRAKELYNAHILLEDNLKDLKPSEFLDRLSNI
jgi:hypothetical protein